MTENTLAFGLRDRPDNLTCAWGARWIWPDDMLHDRQDLFGDVRGRSDLVAWLNGGALDAARKAARTLAADHVLSPRDDNTVTLFEDAAGIVRGNPQGSHGYLYVAAWLKPSSG